MRFTSQVIALGVVFSVLAQADPSDALAVDQRTRFIEKYGRPPRQGELAEDKPDDTSTEKPARQPGAKLAEKPGEALPVREDGMTQIPGTEILLKLPEGFVADDKDRSTVAHADSGAQINAMDFVGGYDKISPEFNAERFSAKSFAIGSEQLVRLEGAKGRLLYGEYRGRDEPETAMILIFGNGARSAVVTTTCPRKSVDEMVPKLREMLLAATFTEAGKKTPGEEAGATGEGGSDGADPPGPAPGGSEPATSQPQDDDTNPFGKPKQDMAPGSSPVYGTRVSLVRPEDFKRDPAIVGFIDPAHGATIVVEETNVPAESVMKAMTPEALTSRGVGVLSEQAVEIDGHAGKLVLTRQTFMNQEVLKWILTFGDEKDTVLITGAFPKTVEETASVVVKEAMLSAKWSDTPYVDPFASLGFRVVLPAGLAFAGEHDGKRVFTASGELKFEDDPNQPVLILYGETGKTRERDHERIARLRVARVTGMRSVAVQELEEVAINGLKGYEVTAQGKHGKTGERPIVYLVVLFDTEAQYFLQAAFPESRKDRVLPLLRRTAATMPQGKLDETFAPEAGESSPGGEQKNPEDTKEQIDNILDRLTK